MSGTGTIDTTEAPQIVEHLNQSLNCTPYDALWVPASPRFVTLGMKPKGTGVIQLYELAEGKAELKDEIEKSQGFKCGTFGASALEDRHLATGNYGGDVQIWDLERKDTPLYNVKGHSGLINSIDGCGGLNVGSGAPELVTAGRDGCVRVWDPRVRDPVVSLEPESAEQARDCWSACFGNAYTEEERCICAGYDNGDVKLFDLRTNKFRWETNVGNGVVCTEFDRKDIDMNKLVVTTLESKFRLYDVRTQHPKHGFSYLTEKAHKSTIWLVRHLPQNRDIFLTAGGNGGINLYKYQYPPNRSLKDEDGGLRGVVGKLDLLNARIMSSQPIIAWDWSPDKQGLAVCAALDQTVRVYIVTKLNKH
eukprot:gb/GECG01000849.1/.p1 GENE.gb/GECG01000849.1/~~gb/GECG01000849.1/.p1  ORF type:complete len:363 (+),score=43.26 gb/GECG01000849.1/:1-1089(+)